MNVYERLVQQKQSAAYCKNVLATENLEDWERKEYSDVLNGAEQEVVRLTSYITELVA